MRLPFSVQVGYWSTFVSQEWPTIPIVSVPVALHLLQVRLFEPSATQVGSLSFFHSLQLCAPPDGHSSAAKAAGARLSISANANNSDKSLCVFCFIISFLPFLVSCFVGPEVLKEPSYRSTIANQCEKTVSKLHRNCIIS